MFIIQPIHELSSNGRDEEKEIKVKTITSTINMLRSSFDNCLK
jgi:hypothetical protein